MLNRYRLAIVLLLLVTLVCFSQEYSDTALSLLAPDPNLKIDGSLQDWLAADPMNLHYHSLVRGSKWDGVDDLSATVWMAANREGLFIAADLRDSNFLGKTNDQEIWESDSLVLTLQFLDEKLAEKRFYILISRDGELPIYSILLEENGATSKMNDFELDLAVEDRSEYAPMLELFISWSEFDSQLSVPSRFEFNVEIRDYDGPGNFKTIAWKPIFANDAQRPGLAMAVVEYEREEITGSIANSSAINTIVQQVNLSVTVLNESNEPRLDLSSSDFIILENGVAQEISDIKLETVPITVGLLIDKSLSMTKHLDDVKESTKEFINTMRPEDRAFVIAFCHEIEELKGFEGDAEEAKTAIDSIVGGGDTALHSTILYSLQKIRYLREKKILIIFSDGENEPRPGVSFFGREIGMSEIIEEAKRNDVAIYPIAFQMGNSDATIGLRRLAANSGGRLFSPSSIYQLVSAYREIANELTSQYRISYVSSNHDLDGQWREITVQLKDKNLRARTKRGYFAQKR